MKKLTESTIKEIALKIDSIDDEFWDLKSELQKTWVGEPFSLDIIKDMIDRINKHFEFIRDQF